MPEIRTTLARTMASTPSYRYPKRLMMTSALPYANGQIHIGHVAGAYLPGDIVRFERMAGSDVVWVCGSDEHGAAITLRAKKDGVTPGKSSTDTTKKCSRRSKDWTCRSITIPERPVSATTGSPKIFPHPARERQL